MFLAPTEMAAKKAITPNRELNKATVPMVVNNIKAAVYYQVEE